MSSRIAFGGFLHETNTFAPSKAGMAAFEQGGGWPPLARGEAISAAVTNVNVGAAGFLDVAREKGWEAVPTLWCAASPSAHVTAEAFEAIAGELVERIRATLPVDGVYLDLHGAMVSENFDDGEGEILRRVRAVIGPGVPLVASLDLHGNVTPLMVEAADMLVAYRTYPHVDMALTGARAAQALAGLLATGKRPAKAFRQIPYLIPIAWQATAMEPCRSIYAELAAWEGETVPSLSFLPGFPAADFPDCGPTVVAYGTTQAEADAAADAIARRVIASEADFKGKVFDPDAGVREAMRLAANATKPIVISDTQDNPGAGGDSDTMGMAAALVRNGAERAAIGVIVDPEAAAAAHEAGEGAVLTLALGARSRIRATPRWWRTSPWRRSPTAASLPLGPSMAARGWILDRAHACDWAGSASSSARARPRWPTARCTGRWASSRRRRRSWSTRARCISAPISSRSPRRSSSARHPARCRSIRPPCHGAGCARACARRRSAGRSRDPARSAPGRRPHAEAPRAADRSVRGRADRARGIGSGRHRGHVVDCRGARGWR